MGRFSDEWLIDKVMFEYSMGGGCACCSFNFLPSGTKGLIEDGMKSELETDAVHAEIAALDTLPWPQELKDQVWMERVRVRQLLKREMKVKFQDFWKLYGNEFSLWLYDQPPQRVLQWFQLPRSEITQCWKEQYKVHAAFGTVLCNVVEQVAFFPLTGYPVDGRGPTEIPFETQLLTFDKRGGFTIKNLVILQTTTPGGEKEGKRELNKEVIDLWLQRHETLGGPKLLDRAPSIQTTKQKKQKEKDGDDGDEEEEEDDDDGEEGGADEPSSTTSPTETKTTASFRADRRLVRLLIARMWATTLQQVYLKEVVGDGNNNNNGDDK